MTRSQWNAALTNQDICLYEPSLKQRRYVASQLKLVGIKRFTQEKASVNIYVWRNGPVKAHLISGPRTCISTKYTKPGKNKVKK